MSQHAQSDPNPAVSATPLAGDAVILFADLQAGIIDMPLTVETEGLRRAAGALAELARIFEIPAFIAAVPGMDGSPAKVIPEIADLPGATEPYRRTTPAAFANAALAEAVAATGRKTVIIAGVSSEVAVLFGSLSALERGYKVQIVVDACGGVSARTEEAAFNRLIAAGVTTTSIASLAGELAGDFGLPKGQKALGVAMGLGRGKH